MDTLAPTWQNKTNVSDAIVFGGDLAATGGASSSWANGAFSKERVGGEFCDYIELDFTFDADLTAGPNGAIVGLCPTDPGDIDVNGAWDTAWKWNTDDTLEAYEAGGKVYDSGVATNLPMSCRIIYDGQAGTETFRSNAGADTLRYTSLRTAAQIWAIIKKGLGLRVTFWGTAGKVHCTLKANTSTPSSIGSLTYEAVFTLQQSGLYAIRSPVATGMPSGGNPRPTAGKIWPRKR